MSLPLTPFRYSKFVAIPLFLLFLVLTVVCYFNTEIWIMYARKNNKSIVNKVHFISAFIHL